MKPVVSVVVVADYADGTLAAEAQLRATLAALARQDFREPVEFLLAEPADAGGGLSPDLAAILPRLKLVLAPKGSSYALKNAGARASSADIVALLDADCVPDPNWLSQLVTVLRERPDVAVVSGRSVYPGRTTTERVLALLSRSYLDEGRRAATRHVSNANGGFRRALLLACPLPEDAGPFASMQHAEAIRRGGGQLLFEPGMRVVHAFGGWPMERDIRRNLGYAAIMSRRRDPRLPHAWIARLGYLAIPLLLAGRTLKNSWRCVRVGRHYGVTHRELALALCWAPILAAMEVPGMIRALRGYGLPESAYR